jgi:16S rRNA (uracil1498-N3)-methyltransferase
MPCFYVPDLKKTAENIWITGEEFHHIVHVRRKKVGDHIDLTNGNGLLADTIITEIGKKKLTVEIRDTKEIKASQPKIAVAFSLLKSKHDNLVIEKLAELGVKEFFPLITERSVRKISPNTTEKFRKAAIAAIKQCDNAFLPEINLPLEINDALEQITNSGFSIIVALETGERNSLNDALAKVADENICILIGPEGGFSSQEIELFDQRKLIPVTLGNHILRAETASIVAVSQILYYLLERDPSYY